MPQSGTHASPAYATDPKTGVLGCFICAAPRLRSAPQQAHFPRLFPVAKSRRAAHFRAGPFPSTPPRGEGRPARRTPTLTRPVRGCSRFWRCRPRYQAPEWSSWLELQTTSGHFSLPTSSALPASSGTLWLVGVVTGHASGFPSNGGRRKSAHTGSELDLVLFGDGIIFSLYFACQRDSRLSLCACVRLRPQDGSIPVMMLRGESPANHRPSGVGDADFPILFPASHLMDPPPRVARVIFLKHFACF